jgi:PAS domain S-box-containing protein
MALLDYEKMFHDCSDKFDSIFNLTSIASKIISSDLIILKVNPAMETLLGYSAEEIIGTRILEYACPEYKQHWHDLQEALWTNKLPYFKLEVGLIKKDKSIVWVKVTTVLFREKGITYGHTVLDDITSLKKIEESEKQLNIALEQAKKIEQELRANEHRLTGILETMAEGVGIIDYEGRVVYANPMARKILGYSPDDDLSKHFADKFWGSLKVDGTPLLEEEHPMTLMMASRKPIYDQEISIQPAVGERFYISINAAPLFNESGELIGGIGTFMDVTARRRMNTLKDEFISVASHELKTPVTSLKASLQLLDRFKYSATDPKVPVLIDQANKSLHRVSILIADLLNASRMNDGQLQLNKTIFKISELIDNCCSNVRLNGEYILHTRGNLQLSIMADADRLDQVITNFVNNAIKYAPNSKDIVIYIEELEFDVKVSVADQGPGIESAKQKHLFERYFRADNSASQSSGLGLGLYISSEIIIKHNGRIGVESEQGIGSTFWFTLPKER